MTKIRWYNASSSLLYFFANRVMGDDTLQFYHHLKTFVNFYQILCHIAL